MNIDSKQIQEAAQKRKNSSLRRKAVLGNRLNQQPSMHDPHAQSVHQQNSSEAHRTSAYAFDRDTPLPEWNRRMHLEVPEPPPGIALRWVRVQTGEKPDTQNVQSALRQGWRPVKREHVPGWNSPPTTLHSQFGEVIGVGGLILFWTTEANVQKREAFYRNQIKVQMTAVRENLFNLNNPKMPLFNESRSRASHSKRQAPVAADEGLLDE